MTTASGESSSASSIAASPSSAVPTTASSGWRSIRGESAPGKARRRPRGELGSCLPHRPPSWIRKLALLAVSVQPPRRKVAVIGAALDLGAGRRGVDMGPSAIRYAGLDSRLAELGLRVRRPGKRRDRGAGGGRGRGRARPVPAPDQGHVRAHCAARRRRRRATGYVPLVLGGDHSVAWARSSGLARGARAGRCDLDRRARRPEQPGDEPERQRPRDGARGGARPRRRPLPGGRLGPAGGRRRDGSRSSASARWTRASGSCWASSTRASSR